MYFIFQVFNLFLEVAEFVQLVVIEGFGVAVLGKIEKIPVDVRNL